MKEFYIPVLPITLEKATDEKLNDRDVPGIELEYPWKDFHSRNLFTGAFVAAGKDGFAISFCGEVPHGKLVSRRTEPKTKVYEDDCYEAFLMPSEADGIYYAWEINPNGACLDYRVFAGEAAAKGAELLKDSPVYDLGENVSGILKDTVAGVPLTFDYSWKSNAVCRMETEDEFWYMELFIPWKDLGLTEPPAPGTTWRATINRVDSGARSRAVCGESRGENQALQTLIEDTELPSFHQPEHFAKFHFVEPD